MSDKQRSSRRNFLKSSSAAVAGAALAGGLSVGRSAHAQASSELKAVLIGCGGRGNGAAVNYLKNTGTKLIAVADAFEDKAKEAAGRFAVPADKVFWGFDAYRKAIDAGCDVCIIATPPAFARSITWRPSRPANTSSWKNPAASTRRGSTCSWRSTGSPMRRI